MSGRNITFVEKVKMDAGVTGKKAVKKIVKPRRLARFALARAGLVAAIFSPSPLLAAESAYTDLKTEACQTLSSEDGMGVTLKCRGLGDMPVYFKEGDLRTAMFFGAVPQRYLDEGFETFGQFNSVGSKMEWRVGANGRPQATILRWFIDNLDPNTGAVDPKRRGQVLVISSVAVEPGSKACTVGYVDALANPDANTLARTVADTVAPGFACGSDSPVYHGVRGEKAGEPSRHLPE